MRVAVDDGDRRDLPGGELGGPPPVASAVDGRLDPVRVAVGGVEQLLGEAGPAYLGGDAGERRRHLGDRGDPRHERLLHAGRDVDDIEVRSRSPTLKYGPARSAETKVTTVAASVADVVDDVVAMVSSDRTPVPDPTSTSSTTPALCAFTGTSAPSRVRTDAIGSPGATT